MKLFNRNKRPEIRSDTAVDETTVSDTLLKALVGDEKIDRSMIMNIPAIASCVNIIADAVASMPVRLYQRDGDTVKEVAGDRRTRLLNEDTGDTLDGCQFKKAMIVDMYLSKGGYAFVNRIGRDVKSIHYVESEKVSFLRNSDPIFKDYQIVVNGKKYEGWQFIKLLRNTKNGYKGVSIIEESQELWGIIYSSLKFEQNLVKTGGNKKGFVQATKKLTEEAMTALKSAFRRLYRNNTENVVVLNDGLQFKESSNTSVEMQLNENKKTNNDDAAKIFLVPPSIIDGDATEEDRKMFYENCLMPILGRFATALNSVLLCEDEKETLFFAFDDSDRTKSDIEKRFGAYNTALSSGWMQVDEVRKKEKLPALGLDFVKLGLQDVLYFPRTGEVYTPNTNKLAQKGDNNLIDVEEKTQKEGEENAVGDQK